MLHIYFVSSFELDNIDLDFFSTIQKFSEVIICNLISVKVLRINV